MDEEEAGISEFRKMKDEFFRNGAESPLDAEEKAAFSGLKYFPYDAKMSVVAKYNPYPEPVPISMSTSRGVREAYLKVGYLEFSLGGKSLKLQAYRSPHGSHSEGLFVPFRDATSGKESYPKARYLDLDENYRVSEDSYRLDFNMAYNPYCAYTDKYICPFPPEGENVLPVPIRAGEKKYK